MSDKEYIEIRLDTQQKWYSKKSRLNKRLFQFFKILEITLSIMLPTLAGFVNDLRELKYTIVILGLVVAIIASMLVIFKFRDKWIEYRFTAELLKREKFMYVTKSGQYKNESDKSLLVERVEAIISRENLEWNQLMKTNEKTESGL